jgi:tetratricopeptide (TPR) repeat protein
MTVEQMLEKAQVAIEAQSWQEAWGVLGQIDHAQLGSKETELLLLAATVRRHQGEIRHAEQLYEELRERVSLQEERLADVVMGIAECAHLRGEFEKAGFLAQAARRIPVFDHKLTIRLACSEAHIRSHINIDQSIELFQLLYRHSQEETTTVWANIAFQYADSLFVAGLYQEALPQFLAAHKIATDTGATVTTADSLRRLPLVRMLLGQSDYALRGVGDLSLAKQLYEVAGDRGAVYLHTEEGEVYRGLGRWRESDRAFGQGLWGSRELRDDNRIAHNLLGMFELSRVAGHTLKWRYLDEAEALYLKLNNEWGLVHTSFARLLADRRVRGKLLDETISIINASDFASFTREKKMLESFRSMHHDEIDRYPHLLNYP